MLKVRIQLLIVRIQIIQTGFCSFKITCKCFTNLFVKSPNLFIKMLKSYGVKLECIHVKKTHFQDTRAVRQVLSSGDLFLYTFSLTHLTHRCSNFLRPSEKSFSLDLQIGLRGGDDLRLKFLPS